MRRLSALLAIACLPLAGVGFTTAPAEAQASRAETSAALQDALRRIARNSNDSRALADAGLAALEMGDTRAAIGFLAKADQIFPNSGRVKAGLARALLKEENPFGAIRYFDEAIANGVAVREIAADRGLAYDLIGRNADAQRDYEIAGQVDQSDQLILRHAVSLGISGDVEGAEAKLNPLLQKSDRAAWRNRAFILAMNGKEKEANTIARQTMQRRMAKAIKPFFDRMPKLTAAQKAAAVHFGHFPASENIGVDVASVRLAANSAVRTGDGADAGLIPVGEPLGEDVRKPRVLAMPDTSPRRRPGKGSSDRRKDRQKQERTSPRTQVASVSSAALPPPDGVRPLVKPAGADSPPASTENRIAATAQTSNEPVSTSGAGLPTGSSAAETNTTVAAAPSPAISEPLVSSTVTRKVDIGGQGNGTGAPAAPVQTASAADTRSAPATDGSSPVSLIDFDLASAAASRMDNAASAGTGSGDGLSSAAPTRSLSSIIGAIEIPAEEREAGVVPVDLSKITPAAPKKPEPEKKAEPVKPEPPQHPKRYWVQIATGADLQALRYDYRRMSRKNADLFDGKSGWTSPWGRTRRLVVGPFDDLKAAKQFEAGFRKGGGDGFAWVSAQGTEVNKLTP